MTGNEMSQVKNMLIFAERIDRDMKGVSRIDFEENDTLQDSTLYRLGQLGETAGNLSEDFKESNPAVPWRQMADMRNRLFHFYDAINMDIVFEVAAQQIPAIIAELKQIISTEGR